MKRRRRNSAKTTVQAYSADRPIVSKRQDILGRAKFAARLADDLHNWSGDDSLVVALYGTWGSGKTSVKNLLLEANRKRRRLPLKIVDFNPWQLSGTGGIPASFFRELGLALGDQGPKRDVEKRAKRLKTYAGTLSVMGTTTDLVGTALQLAGVPGSTMLKNIGRGMKSAGTTAKAGSETLSAMHDAESKSLEAQKSELAELLARLPQPLLVVIDDIDRLTTSEILQVFQLVKANADFPCLIYLLLFEREVVGKALDEVSGGKGTEFLEKIVQVGYHVPQVSRAALQKVLFAGIDKHLDQMPVSKYWDKQRWGDLYFGGIDGYFRNLRQVYRFLASFAFHVQHHRGQNSFEVNPVDLIGLETIRVFEPSVYERLPGAKTILTRYDGPSLFGEIKQEVVDLALSQIVSASAPDSASRVKEILKVLFPPLSSAYGGKEGVSAHHNEWLRALRVCHPNLFDKYFTLTVADDDVSQAELEGLLALSSHAQKFVAACDALKKRGLLKVAFDRLEAYKEEVPLQSMPSLIQALCDLSDSFPTRVPGLLETDIETTAYRLVYFGLKREPDPKTRGEILRDAITRSTGLALPVHVVNDEKRVGALEARRQEYLVEEGSIASLTSVCVEKLRAAAKNPMFCRDPRLLIFLHRWSEWTTLEEVRAWLARHTEDAKGAIWLLTVLLGETHSWGREHRMRYYIHLPTVEKFSDVTKLTQLVGTLKESGLLKKESIALREFKKALKRREEGKSDEAWKNSDEYEDEEVND